MEKLAFKPIKRRDFILLANQSIILSPPLELTHVRGMGGGPDGGQMIVAKYVSGGSNTY